MKLKYKKIILFIFICTLGIGVLTLSLLPRDKVSKDRKAEDDSSAATSSAADATIAPTPIPDFVSEPQVTEGPTPTPTIAPTPTPLPIYPLESEGYPEIEALMKDYYDAKFNCDVKKLKTIMSDPSDVPSKKTLEADVLYVEEYQNLKCYVKKSYEEDSYIVVVYYEIKFMNIKTPAPAVKRFYVIPDGQGGYKIFSGTLDEELQEYYDARLQDADIQEVIQDTEAKSKKAREKDEFLATFWEQLQAVQKNQE